MAPIRRIIIDTDPGVDDILAILLALAASPQEVEVILLSVTFGNTDLQNCLRNAVSMFHVIEKELEWRRNRGQLEGFDSLKVFKPIVAVGAEQPLEDQLLMADYFRAFLNNWFQKQLPHPHLTPDESWKTLFEKTSCEEDGQVIAPQDSVSSIPSFTASKLVAHKEILRVLRENELDTITIVAIGPLTNLALAAAEDPEAFLRVKEVVVMGGAVDVEGNAVASARVYALTSPDPLSTLPPLPPPSSHTPSPAKTSLGPYPPNLSRPLKLTLFPLDITTGHLLMKSDFEAKVKPIAGLGSPLAEWVCAFVERTFQKMESWSVVGGEVGLSLHDPLWYILTSTSPTWILSPSSPEDVRVECAGQWTRGMCVVDRRLRRKAADGEEIIGDTDGWLNPRKGNRVRRMAGSPGEDAFAHYLLERIFG
ncbi:hypothetical protein FGG08_004774 [Glutinoglossum americanum]|uniref:Inosine/uridine-preferring nucleoside hydrolase domain-containing protein n=1 Tax=Glutinoglossum americanum TaxID=1670608 RepID=A0A9P8L2D8_9PEZI|nr:hypothetical protein FGG08_004774 [Glutinoglossum americanum]